MHSSIRGTRYLMPACLAAFALGMWVERGRSQRRVGTALERHAETAARLEHDLRTPIGTIASAASLLEGAANDPALRDEALEVIVRQVSRLSDLANSLSGFARELGQSPAPPPETPLPPRR